MREEATSLPTHGSHGTPQTGEISEEKIPVTPQEYYGSDRRTHELQGDLVEQELDSHFTNDFCKDVGV